MSPSPKVLTEDIKHPFQASIIKARATRCTPIPLPVKTFAVHPSKRRQVELLSQRLVRIDKSVNALTIPSTPSMPMN